LFVPDSEVTCSRKWGNEENQGMEGKDLNREKERMKEI
jgi:hypothetical protein